MKVVLIQPPYMALSKPDYCIPKSLEIGVHYMCPALVIQATHLEANNIEVKIVVIDKHFKYDDLDKRIIDTDIVGISCTSAWEYLETLAIAEHIKLVNPSIFVCVGGWQFKSICDRSYQDSKYIDCIDISDRDDGLVYLCGLLKDNKHLTKRLITSADRKNDPISVLSNNFSLFPNYKSYIPYVEESRGCPHKCSFCLNASLETPYSNCSINQFMADISNVKKYYPEQTNLILLSANFGVNAKKTKEKLKLLQTENFKLNLEMHVDNPWEDYIKLMKPAGVTKVSIGLESASLKTLITMNKTNNPVNYLFRANSLLRELKELGIRTTVNILLHYKDSYHTLQETCSWLFENISCIDRIRFNNFYYFEGLSKSSSNINDLGKYIIQSRFNTLLHVYPLLPVGFELDKAINFFDVFEKMFRTKDET